MRRTPRRLRPAWLRPRPAHHFSSEKDKSRTASGRASRDSRTVWQRALLQYSADRLVATWRLLYRNICDYMLPAGRLKRLFGFVLEQMDGTLTFNLRVACAFFLHTSKYRARRSCLAFALERESTVTVTFDTRARAR